MRIKVNVICALVFASTMLSACGSGVDQNEYARVVAERDELKDTLSQADKQKALDLKLAEYNADADSDYRSVTEFNSFLTTLTGYDLSEAQSNVDSTYNSFKEQLKSYENADDIDAAITKTEELSTIWNEAIETSYTNYANIAQNLKSAIASGGNSANTVTTKDSNTLVYEDDKVKIYYVGINSRGVRFKVDNLTDANITVQADSISVNRQSVNDIIMSDNVAPQSIGEVVAKCSVGNIGEVETIGGQLRIIDFNKNFKSYEASFVNVEVE